MVESGDFNHGPTETPMTEPSMPLIELLQKQDDGDLLRAVAEAVLPLVFPPATSDGVQPERSHDGRTGNRVKTKAATIETPGAINRCH